MPVKLNRLQSQQDMHYQSYGLERTVESANTVHTSSLALSTSTSFAESAELPVHPNPCDRNQALSTRLAEVDTDTDGPQSVFDMLNSSVQPGDEEPPPDISWQGDGSGGHDSANDVMEWFNPTVFPAWLDDDYLMQWSTLASCGGHGTELSRTGNSEVGAAVPNLQTSGSGHKESYDAAAQASGSADSPDFLQQISPGTVSAVAEVFFSGLHTSTPVLDRAEIECAIEADQLRGGGPLRTCLLAILAVVTSTQVARHRDNNNACASLLPFAAALSEAAVAASIPRADEGTSLHYIAANILLCHTFNNRGEDRSAWFHLQQAITLAQVLDIDDLDLWHSGEDSLARLKLFLML